MVAAIAARFFIPAIELQGFKIASDYKPQRHKGHKEEFLILCALCVFVVYCLMIIVPKVAFPAPQLDGS
jgi:hypothetical protein